MTDSNNGKGGYLVLIGLAATFFMAGIIGPRIVGGNDVPAEAAVVQTASPTPIAAQTVPVEATPTPAPTTATTAAPPAALAPETPRVPPADACVNEWCGKALANARLIVQIGQEQGLPRRAWVIAVATAMQESSLLNEASTVFAVTQQLPHDSLGKDHDSVGLFQQRPSQGWGTPEELMDPRTATKKFYNALVATGARFPGWQEGKVELWRLAQATQKSAFPLAYQKREAGAIAVVTYLLSA